MNVENYLKKLKKQVFEKEKGRLSRKKSEEGTNIDRKKEEERRRKECGEQVEQFNANGIIRERLQSGLVIERKLRKASRDYNSKTVSVKTLKCATKEQLERQMDLNIERFIEEREKNKSIEYLRTDLENTRKKSSRHIPSCVRREVWRRDKGRCVNCGSRRNLEYDHIIPFSEGGSNTARNIELLCEECNRKKSNNIA